MRAQQPVWIAGSVLLLLAGGCNRSERPELWPVRPVRLIVPYGPGSSTDLVARLFAPRLAERFQQSVVVDNRPGGDGVTGVQAFVTANDRHTLLFAPMGVITTNPLLHERLPFDPARDLLPIAAAGRPSIAIAVANTVGVESLSDLVALVRRRPGEYLWAGTPGLPELVFRAFLELDTLQMKHVAYRDIVPAVHDLGAGRIHVMIATLTTMSPALQSGATRLVAVTTTTRAPMAPDVPTAAEAGYPTLTVEGPFGFFGWRDMPAALRDRIAADVQYAAADEAMVSRLAKVGFVVGAGTAEEFAQAIENQRQQVDGIARIVGLKRPGEEHPSAGAAPGTPQGGR